MNNETETVKRKVIATSVEAYKSLTVAELNDTYKKIIASLGELGEGTFEEIAIHAKMDKSRVWKRMSELERMEIAYRPGNKRLLKSGRNGYTWMLTNASTPKTVTAEKALKGDSVADYSRRLSNLADKAIVQPTLF